MRSGMPQGDTGKVLVCWYRDGGIPGGRMILCVGLAGGNERGKRAGVGRPLRRKSGRKRGEWGREGYLTTYQ